jgi:hypothetical protein
MSGAELKEGIHSDRGDVIAKYHPQQFASLKDEGVNPLIFAHLDTLNTVTNMINNGDIAAADVILKDSVDDIFDRTVVAKEESDEEVCIDDI